MSYVLDKILANVNPYANATSGADAKTYYGTLPITTIEILHNHVYILFSKQTGNPCGLKSGTSSADSITELSCSAPAEGDLVLDRTTGLPLYWERRKIRIFIVQKYDNGNFLVALQSELNGKYLQRASNNVKSYRFSSTNANATTNCFLFSKTTVPGEWLIADYYDRVTTNISVYVSGETTTTNLTFGQVVFGPRPANCGTQTNSACTFFLVDCDNLGKGIYIGQPNRANSCKRKTSALTCTSDNIIDCQNSQDLPVCCVNGLSKPCPAGSFSFANSNFGGPNDQVTTRASTSCSKAFVLNAFEGETIQDRAIACCTQKLTGQDQQRLCPAEFCPDGDYCRNTMTQFCMKPENLNKYPECGCFFSTYDTFRGLFGTAPPQCIDKRCVNQIAYKYNGIEDIQCNLVQCVINIDTLTLEQQATLTPQFKQDCKSTQYNGATGGSTESGGGYVGVPNSAPPNAPTNTDTSSSPESAPESPNGEYIFGPQADNYIFQIGSIGQPANSTDAVLDQQHTKNVKYTGIIIVCSIIAFICICICMFTYFTTRPKKNKGKNYNGQNSDGLRMDDIYHVPTGFEFLF